MLEARPIGAPAARSARVEASWVWACSRSVFGRDARGIAVLRDLQRPLVAFDRLAEQGHFAVGLAQREIVDRERAPWAESFAEPRSARARLGAGERALDAAAELAPEVGRPIGGERDG